MGGRGGASGFPTNAPIIPAAPKSAAETHNLTELEQYMANVGITVDTASLAGQTFENVRDAAAAIEQIVTEFPQARLTFNRLRGEYLKNGVLANASFSGNITLSNQFFSKTEDSLNAVYNNEVQRGFHPAGTKKADIAAHEAGHILEAALVHRAYPGTAYSAQQERAKAWNKSTISAKIVSEACKAAKKTAQGKGMKNADLIRDVSGYAKTNRSETLAECVADYAANGTSAKPLSVAVWNILKDKLV